MEMDGTFYYNLVIQIEHEDLIVFPIEFIDFYDEIDFDSV